jgi:ubiquitin C-terminal hydrolase
MRRIVPSNHISVGGVSYDLYSVSFHLGRSLHIGHYTCICKRSNSWFYFNDDIVEEINIDINEWIKENDLNRSVVTAAYKLK